MRLSLVARDVHAALLLLNKPQKEDAPQLYALKERVAAVPGMAAYIASEKRHPARKD